MAYGAFVKTDTMLAFLSGINFVSPHLWDKFRSLNVEIIKKIDEAYGFSVTVQYLNTLF